MKDSANVILKQTVFKNKLILYCFGHKDKSNLKQVLDITTSQVDNWDLLRQRMLTRGVTHD